MFNLLLEASLCAAIQVPESHFCCFDCFIQIHSKVSFEPAFVHSGNVTFN